MSEVEGDVTCLVEVTCENTLAENLAYAQICHPSKTRRAFGRMNGSSAGTDVKTAWRSERPWTYAAWTPVTGGCQRDNL